MMMVMVVVVMMVVRRHHYDHAVVVVVVMRDQGCHPTSHDPSSPDHRRRGVTNRPMRRDLRHDAMRSDNRQHVMVVVVMMMRRQHDDHVAMVMVMVMVVVVVVVVEIGWRRAVILRLDQPAAGRFLRIGESQPRSGVGDGLEQFGVRVRRRDSWRRGGRTGAASR
jgi:hypothetical protein